MKKRYYRAVAASLASLWAATPVAVLAQQPAATSAPAPVPNAEATAFFETLDAYYQQGGDPNLVNDTSARLAVYRETLRRLEASPLAVHSDPRYRSTRLFYATMEAVTASQVARNTGPAKIDRLIAEARAANQGDRIYSNIPYSLSMLLRERGQIAQVAGDYATALPLYREAADLTQMLINDGVFQARDEAERALAIDLDNLSNMEAQHGDAATANTLSNRALALFRSLAVAAPDSRPAQGSLLISLFRRIVNFQDRSLLDEAERQVAVMRSRGQLIGQYTPVVEGLAEIRAGQGAARP
jgi:tetratricopeptide (TPR) repeat protein